MGDIKSLSLYDVINLNTLEAVSILCCKTQKLSVTKIYSVGFNHDADFDADHDAEILCKRTMQSDCP